MGDEAIRYASSYYVFFKGFAKLFQIIVLMNLKYSALMFLRNIAEIGNFFL